MLKFSRWNVLRDEDAAAAERRSSGSSNNTASADLGSFSDFTVSQSQARSLSQQSSQSQRSLSGYAADTGSTSMGQSSSSGGSISNSLARLPPAVQPAALAPSKGSSSSMTSKKSSSFFANLGRYMQSPSVFSASSSSEQGADRFSTEQHQGHSQQLSDLMLQMVKLVNEMKAEIKAARGSTESVLREGQDRQAQAQQHFEKTLLNQMTQQLSNMRTTMQDSLDSEHLVHSVCQRFEASLQRQFRLYFERMEVSIACKFDGAQDLFMNNLTTAVDTHLRRVSSSLQRSIEAAIADVKPSPHRSLLPLVPPHQPLLPSEETSQPVLPLPHCPAKQDDPEQPPVDWQRYPAPTEWMFADDSIFSAVPEAAGPTTPCVLKVFRRRGKLIVRLRWQERNRATVTPSGATNLL